MTSATIFPDTTILIQYQSLDRINWRSVLGVSNVKLVLATAVLQEIEDIRNQEISPSLAKRAASVLESIRTLLQDKESLPAHLKIHEAGPPEIDFLVERLNPNSVADLLMATVITYQSKHALEYVVLFSDDNETRFKADKSGVEYASLPDDYLFGKAEEASGLTTQNPPDLNDERDNKSATSNLITPSPKRLVKPTPLFKNKFMALEAQSDKPDYAETPPPTQPGKRAEVIEPEEAPTASPVTAVEHPTLEKVANEVLATPAEAPPLPPAEIRPAASDVEVPEKESEVISAKPLPPEKPVPLSPFVDIKQAPARRDPGHVEFFNLPEAPDSGKPATSVNGINHASENHEHNQTQPLRTEQNPPRQHVTQPDQTDQHIPQPDQAGPNQAQPNQTQPNYTPSFSFSSHSSSARAPSNAPPPLPEAEPPEEKAELRLAFENDETRSTLIIHHPEYPSIDDVSESITRLRKNYPKLALLGTPGGDGIDSGLGNGLSNAMASYKEPVAATGGEIVFQRKNLRIKRYNDALDSYYANAEKYLSEVAEFENLRRRSARLDLVLINEFPDALKSLYIGIHFPSNLRVFSEDNLPEKPVGPAPPEEPNLDALFDKLRLPSVPIPGELSPDYHDIKMRSRNLAPIEMRWNKGWDVIYSKREIAKGDRIPFNPLFIVFNSFEQAMSFRIHFRITVASASYEEKGDLEVLVRKEI